MDEAQLKSDERARAAAITAAMSAQSQRQNQNRASIPGISESLPNPARKSLYYAGFFVLAVAAHVLGYLLYANYVAKNEPPATAPVDTVVLQPAPPPQPLPPSSTQPSPQVVQPVIVQTPPPKNNYVTTTRPSSPAPTPALRQDPAPQEPTVAQHTRAAEEYAYYYFRYKYKVGPNSVIATSVEIAQTDTAQVSGWALYRTTGEAYYNFYVAGGNFKRGSAKFEVQTEVKNGKVSVVDITVKP